MRRSGVRISSQAPIRELVRVILDEAATAVPSQVFARTSVFEVREGKTLMATALFDDVTLRPAWHSSAACRREPVDTFFGAAGASYERARALCASCPAVRACLEEALADRTIQGFWGATSERERARIRRQRKAA
jgi:WhiB family redox-sensing transcriptional regulator